MKSPAHRPSSNCSFLHLAASRLGQSVNPKLAGLIGRHGPQTKQPFMVAFFKATEVHLRSTRSTGGKQRSQNRSKTPKNQEALRVANVAGTPGAGGLTHRPQGTQGGPCRTPAGATHTPLTCSTDGSGTSAAGSKRTNPDLYGAPHLHCVKVVNAFRNASSKTVIERDANRVNF